MIHHRNSSFAGGMAACGGSAAVTSPDWGKVTCEDCLAKRPVHHREPGEPVNDCGEVARQGEGLSSCWTDVTCSTCLLAQPRHHRPRLSNGPPTCGVSPRSFGTASDWANVTCRACLLKRPWVPRETSQWEKLLEVLEERWPEGWTLIQDDGRWVVGKHYADSFEGLIEKLAEPELLPCRWCEGTAARIDSYNERYRVMCNKCDASGPSHPERATAIKMWNKGML